MKIDIKLLQLHAQIQISSRKFLFEKLQDSKETFFKKRELMNAF